MVGRGFGSGWVCWDVVVPLLGVSGRVVVDLCCRCVVVVMFWSIGVRSLVDEWVCFCCYSMCVEVEDVEDFELCHDGSSVRSGGGSFE